MKNIIKEPNATIVNAVNTFLSGCWKKVDDYYKDAIKDKNIYIYGSGIYGKFLFNVLSHLGYSEQILGFINDYVTNDNESLFDIPVKKCGDIVFTDGDIIVIGIQNNANVIRILNEKKLNYIVADYDQSFYQDNLMYSVYKCIKTSSISDMVGKIMQYYSGILGNDDDILSLYDEKISKENIKNRLAFYKTGDISYIDKIPVNYHQYFQDDYYSISEKEVFVDCGAFDGDSINDFWDFTKGKYKKIIGLEPDTISFDKLRDATKDYHDVQLICCATGKENTKVCFSSQGVLGSTFSDDGNGDLTDVKKLDDILKDEKPTLIKMDIEGAELDTLIGAENTIRKFKPKLAVCIYHKIEDIITIPKYLHSLVPEYKYRVRQHSSSMLETVLYAEI